MPERDGFQTLADLIGAIGESWFPSTLRGTLQMLFHHDYLLIAYYQRGSPLAVLHSNFNCPETRRAVHWLETETHVLEPIHRLVEADRCPGGVYDMSTLVQLAAELPPGETSAASLPHVIEDSNEEIGWRTLGWPRYQQETCLLVPLESNRLLAISLYNADQDRHGHQSAASLQRACALLQAIVAKHAGTACGQHWCRRAGKTDSEDRNGGQLGVASVKQFFLREFSIALTDRETDVFAHLLIGTTIPVVARELDISVHTAKTHRRNVYCRIGNVRLPELINRYHCSVQGDAIQ